MINISFFEYLFNIVFGLEFGVFRVFELSDADLPIVETNARKYLKHLANENVVKDYFDNHDWRIGSDHSDVIARFICVKQKSKRLRNA